MNNPTTPFSVTSCADCPFRSRSLDLCRLTGNPIKWEADLCVVPENCPLKTTEYAVRLITKE